MAGPVIERHPVAAPGLPDGWSYGGYPTLVALTRWPDHFAAGATLAGMSDLRTFFAGIQPWMAAAAVTGYGDHHVELSERVAARFDRWL